MKKVFLPLIAAVLFSPAAEGRQPQRGYRGFIEWSNSMRSDKYGYWNPDFSISGRHETSFYTGVATSHGYQINQLFYVGAGLGLERCGKCDNWIAPLFIDGRVDLKFGRFTPFGDIRLGFNAAEGGGVYFSPTIGYRFNWGRKAGVNIGAGLTLAGYKSEIYSFSYEGPGSYETHYIETKNLNRLYFSFRLGFDF